MATPFLDSEEYDENAHRLYDNGEFDRALEVLKDGLALYPSSIELLVGLGYTRLAREEFAWSRVAFEKALAIEPNHDEALAGLGEVMLRFGRHQEALQLFRRVRTDTSAISDLDLTLSIGRALYREQLFHEALGYFDAAVAAFPDQAEALAARAYTLHRLDDPNAALESLRHAISLDPTLHEARTYLAHLLYDRGEWRDALDEFCLVPAREQWDSLAICRLLELEIALGGGKPGDSRLEEWDDRLDELTAYTDPIDELLAEIEHDAAARYHNREPR